MLLSWLKEVQTRLMIDEKGNRIDLNLIDAIGELGDGSFDV